MKTEALIDDDDYSRVGYFVRKYKGPVALAALGQMALSKSFSGRGSLRTNGTLRIDSTLTGSGPYCWTSGSGPSPLRQRLRPDPAVGHAFVFKAF